MSKRFVLAALLVGLGAAGCTTTSPDKKYQADEPPPLARGERGGPTTLDPVKLPAARTGVSAENIDDTNLADAARRLESEMKVEKKALTQAGR